MKVMGIDLAGPSNHRDTVMTLFQVKEEGLFFEKQWKEVSDQQIFQLVQTLTKEQPLFIGIDSPLSYEDGGGLRQLDKELQTVVKSIGMRSSSVMPPTFTRMAYLTLRGIALTRLFLSIPTPNPIQIAEVHPGAVFGLRMQKEIHVVLNYKKDQADRERVASYFPDWSMFKVPNEVSAESHTLDSCGAALGVWAWSRGEAKWVGKARPPFHPFPIVC
ncbi:DUF429 domain-containing protein [Ammoniphilus sp. YIM 78166]|uniref:DUF429 domain-containing protein n=1 Tax=Ammoniphilus sp. YIM 78166 TaxID=1644106 RepID=UPI00143201FD|nr:DUF429 domain-containing protein [Ammoniphilus sp. YIM 78166]